MTSESDPEATRVNTPDGLSRDETLLVAHR